MPRDKHPVHIVYILKPGEGIRPHKLRCENPYCRRVMFTLNREIETTITDSQGIHWADTPEDVTVIEHKCRGCEYIYHIYTPEIAAAIEITARLNAV